MQEKRVSRANAHRAPSYLPLRYFAELAKKHGAPRAAGAWRALRFVARHCSASLELPARCPRFGAKQAGTADSRQAPPVPPQALFDLEATATVAVPKSRRHDAALVALSMTGSWLRFRHLQRSVPTKLTDHTLYGTCLRGKVADDKRASGPPSSGRSRGFPRREWTLAARCTGDGARFAKASSSPREASS